MKTLKKEGTKNINFDSIAINEHFIYNDEPFEFLQLKLTKTMQFL